MNRDSEHDAVQLTNINQEVVMKLIRTAFTILALTPLAVAWAQDADSLYRDGRRALNRGNFDAAIVAFRSLREEYPDSDYVGDSYYWQAFALERNGDLEQVVDLVDRLLEEYPQAEIADDARALRVQVCSALAQRGDTACAEVVSATVRNTNGLDETTRRAAVNALINMPAERAIPIASQVATNRTLSTGVRRQALFVLADKAEEADQESTVRELLRTIALDDTDDSEVRAQAVFWLSEIPGDETLAILSGIVEQSSDSRLRERAIFAIAQIEQPAAMALLQQYALDESLDTEQRKRAIFWIANEGEAQAIPFLQDLYVNLTDSELRQQVLFAVSEAGESDAIDWLLQRARDTGETLEVRKRALFWAADVGMSTSDLNTLYADFEDPELREHLIWLIAENGGDDSVDSLLNIANSDPDVAMRTKAIFWLGESDDPRATEYLLELLGQSQESR